MVNKKKKGNGLLFWMRGIVFLALGLLAVLGYSLIISLDFDFKLMIFLGLLVFIIVVILLGLFTNMNLISKADMRGFLSKKRK